MAGKRIIKCNNCSCSTSNQSHLKQHWKAVHEKLKPYKCEECPYAASLKHHLQYHVKGVHEDARTYKCEQCPYAASGKRRLQYHVKGVHEKAGSGGNFETFINKFSCCGIVTVSSSFSFSFYQHQFIVKIPSRRVVCQNGRRK